MLELVIALAQLSAPVSQSGLESTSATLTTTAAMVTPRHRSAVRKGRYIKLNWVQDGNLPPGGFDIIINGTDTNRTYRTRLLTATVGPLATDRRHCFRIQANYRDGKVRNSPALCAPAQWVRSDSGNRMPAISGATPTTLQLVGQRFEFVPVARDADADLLRFFVHRRPSWASFDRTTGRLHGTPGLDDVGRWGNVMIYVSDGLATVALPPFALRIEKGTTSGSNRAPVISGQPPSSIAVGETFSFTPKASDPDGDALTFSVQNRPGWMAFNSRTGRLSGTPSAANVGTWTDIRLRVSDGKASASLAPFSISVNQSGQGSVTLNWNPPTQREDGTPLRALAGYRVFLGRTGTDLSRVINVPNGGLSSYTVTGLSSGTWYLAMKAYDTEGLTSRQSTTVRANVD
jgi:hypothetical protein